MALLVFGFLVLLIGVMMMRNSEMDRALKKFDADVWTTIMSPSPSGYVNSFGIIPLFSWILTQGFEDSESLEVKELGKLAFKKAKLAKYCMLLGVLMMILGLALSVIMASN